MYSNSLACLLNLGKAAFRNSEGKGGYLNWNPKAWGDTYDWNSVGIGGF